MEDIEEKEFIYHDADFKQTERSFHIRNNAYVATDTGDTIKMDNLSGAKIVYKNSILWWYFYLNSFFLVLVCLSFLFSAVGSLFKLNILGLIGNLIIAAIVVVCALFFYKISKPRRRKYILVLKASGSYSDAVTLRSCNEDELQAIQAAIMNCMEYGTWYNPANIKEEQ